MLTTQSDKPKRSLSPERRGYLKVYIPPSRADDLKSAAGGLKMSVADYVWYLHQRSKSNA